MRKLFLIVLIIAATFSAGLAQEQGVSTQGADNVPNMGRAPSQPDGLGRLDLRVVDENGNPLKGVRADLKSKRGDGFLCESWNWTDVRGVAVLPPIHMGSLKLTVKAPGYQTQKLEIAASKLSEPVRVTMLRKN